MSAGILAGVGPAYAFKLTAHSYDDGYNAGITAANNGKVIHCSKKHSDTYCRGFSDGYSSISNNVGTNSQASAIDGNNIKGDGNTINQQIVNVNRHNSDNGGSSDNNDNNDNNDGNGQLPRCKAFCLGVQ